MLSALSQTFAGMFLRYPNRAALEQYEITADKEIPFHAPVDDCTVRTQEGDFVRTYYVRGVTFECVDDSMVNALHNQLNRAFMLINNIADGRLSIYTHLIRRRSSASPRRTFAPGYADELNQRYSARMSELILHESGFYLSIVYRAATQGIAPFLTKQRGMSQDERRSEDQFMLEEFDEITRALEEGCKSYGLERLTEYEYNGNTFSQQMELYHYIVNGYDMRFPVTRDNLQDTLLTARPIFRNTLGVIHGDESVYIAVLSVADYQEHTFPGHLDALLALQFEFVFTQSFTFLPREKVKGMMKLHHIHMEQMSDDAASQVGKINMPGEGGALNDLSSRLFDMGMYHGEMVVKGENAEAIRDNIARARGAFADAGILVKRDWLGSSSAYWSQLPGNGHFNRRPVPLTTLNFAGLTSFHRFVRGRPAGNHWGPSVAMLRTASGDPYHLNFHVADVGNTLVVGPIGSGKTVLLSFLNTQLDQFGASGIVFDYKRDMEAGVRALGGDYFVLQNGEPTGCNPFQMDATNENIMFVQLVVRTALEEDGPRLSVKEREQLDGAIAAVFKLPRESRRFAKVMQSLNENEELGTRILQWVGAGPKAWLFDNETDRIDFQARLTGFDMTSCLDNKEIKKPLMMYLFFRMQQLIGRGRIYTIIDEFWRVLDDEFFVEEFRKRTKTTRSQDWFFVVASQSAADAVGSIIFPTIVDNFATKICLPNPNAKHADYALGLEFSEAEFETVKGLPINSHLFMIKQGRESGVVLLDLQGMDDDLAILSPGAANIKLLDAIRKEVGDNPAAWMPAFHARRKKK